jgi:transposase
MRSPEGDPGVRRWLTLGASTVLRHVRSKPQRGAAWRRGILARRPVKVAVVAQADRADRLGGAG